MNKLKFTREDVIHWGLQYGNLKRRWNKSYNLIILGSRDDIIIFNVDYSLYSLRRAYQLVYFLGLKKSVGLIIWSFNIVVTDLLTYYRNKFKQGILISYYQGVYYGGLISNFNFFRTQENLKFCTFNFKSLNNRNPSFLIVGNNTEFFNIFNEAMRMWIPSISIIDSDLNYNNIMYPICANVNSILVNYFFIHSIIILLKKSEIERYKNFINKLYHVMCLIIKVNIYIYNKKILKKLKLLKQYKQIKKLIFLNKMKYIILYNFILKMVILLLKFRINWSIYYKHENGIKIINDTFIIDFMKYIIIYIKKCKKIKVRKLLRTFFKKYLMKDKWL